MKCSRALRLISCIIDGVATEHQRRLLEFHLLGCSSCRRAHRMSSDISRLTAELPAPTPPPTLEADVMRMIREKTATPVGQKRKFRATILAIPAAAALIAMAVSISPISRTPETSVEGLTISSGIPLSMKYMSEGRSGAKSRVRTVPLSAYSRQASLISF